MNPVLVTIGGFEIRWYSVLILVGVILAYILIMSESRRYQIKKEFVFNMMFWALIFGIIGARLYYVLFNWDYYGSNIKEIFMIWHGGLAIHGGMILGLITVVIYCKKYKVNLKKMLDIIVPGLILAQAIGRWGNFFNQEAYGSPVEYEFLVNMKIIPQFIIDNMYINGQYYLPMFYFESIACFIGFIIMLIMRRRKYTKNGQIAGFYLFWYGLIRFVIEIFRTDSLMLFNIKIAQAVSIIMIIVGLYIIFNQMRKPKLDDLYNTIEKEINY